MNTHRFVITLGILLTGVATASATEIGFGQLGGSNATIPRNLGSFATADGNGFVVSNGATPNIALTWDVHDPATNHWDIHTFGGFADLENKTIGVGAWDNEGDIPRIAQLDFGFHTIEFTADPGYAVVINSFDLGHQPETAGSSEWSLTLTDSSAIEVWSEFVTLDNTDPDAAVFTISPDFTGLDGESYTLSFIRISDTYGSDGRHGIDNLSFNQVAVPEPGTVALLGAAGFGALILMRRRK